MRSQVGRYLFQLLIGLDGAAQFEPALGGQKVAAVGWFERLNCPCIRLLTRLDGDV